MIFLVLLLALFAAPAVAQTASTPRPPAPVLFPFVLPPFDSSTTPTDVSWMNDAPAGAHGFVSTRGEHFVDGRGKILRLWGVNINFAGAFPSKNEAPKIAARLAKFGFNAVRMHHYEGYAAPNGIWKAAAVGSSKPRIPREFDPEQLDRFEFFIAELIKRGIYIDLNLHVARKTTEGEGVLYASVLPEKDKGVKYFDKRLIQLQQDFSRAILTHVNPYTGRALKDEPGVCAMEVANEDSLLGSWLEGDLSMPNDYAFRLNDRWMTWLRARYPTQDVLRRAWTEVNEPISGDDIFAQPLPPGIANGDAADARNQVALNELSRMKLAAVSGAQGTTSIDATSGPSVDGFVRPGITVNLQKSGAVAWAFQLNRDGLDLQEGQAYTVSFWARADTPRRISVNLWQDREPRRFQGFTGYANLTVNWEQYSFVFRPVNPDPKHSRLSWNLGKDTGAVQLGEIELRTGGRIAAPDTWTLARGVPNIEWKSTPIARARRDFAEFLGGVENESVRQMRSFLRNDLGVKVPIWNTQAQFGSWGGVAREGDLSDAVDVHAYWKHPTFKGGGWSGTNWKVGNDSMTSAAAIDPLSAFAFSRVRGKPFVMSEWNSGQPNDFGAESLLMAASYAAWQDWAGIFLFDYHSNGDYGRNRFEGFFSIDTQPAKMATAPAAALLFRRPPGIEYSNGARSPLKVVGATSSNDNLPGDALPATDVVTLSVPRDWVWDESAAVPDGPSAAPFVRTWQNAGGVRSMPLQSRVYAQLGSGVFARSTRTTANALGKTPLFQADTRQVLWDSKKNIFSLDTPRSKVAVGFLGARFTQLGEWQWTMPRSQSNWASLSLSSLDGRDISSSKSLLLTAVGKAENIGMGWNADRSSVGDKWGSGPTQVEGITASMRVLTDLKSARVWALDETGARRQIVPSRLKNGVLAFTISPAWKTTWYQIEG